MTLRFKRSVRGQYEGCTMTFNRETNKHEPIFIIAPNGTEWRLTEHHNEVGRYTTLKAAKDMAQRIEDRKPMYRTDEDEGMTRAHYAPGQTIGTYISAERISGRLYVSDDGNAIISETRYPDGTITTERRGYGA